MSIYLCFFFIDIGFWFDKVVCRSFTPSIFDRFLSQFFKFQIFVFSLCWFFNYISRLQRNRFYQIHWKHIGDRSDGKFLVSNFNLHTIDWSINTHISIDLQILILRAFKNISIKNHIKKHQNYVTHINVIDRLSQWSIIIIIYLIVGSRIDQWVK